jgi:hypothetical protein
MPTFCGSCITYIFPRDINLNRGPRKRCWWQWCIYFRSLCWMMEIILTLHSAGFEVPSCLHSALTCTSLRCMLAKYDLFSSPTTFVCWKTFGNNTYWNTVLINFCYVLDLHSILLMFLHSSMLAFGVPPSLSLSRSDLCLCFFFLRMLYIRCTDYNYSVFVYLTILCS